MTVNEFLDLVRRSQLVEEDQLTKFLGGLAARDGCGYPGTSEELAGELVRENLLTEWQTGKLLAGKYKGFQLDQYRLLKHLAKHELCQVYLALHTIMKRLVEIWVLPPQRGQDYEYGKRVRDAAQVAAKQRKVSILQDFNRDVSGYTQYIVMEYKAS